MTHASVGDPLAVDGAHPLPTQPVAALQAVAEIRGLHRVVVVAPGGGGGV